MHSKSLDYVWPIFVVVVFVCLCVCLFVWGLFFVCFVVVVLTLGGCEGGNGVNVYFQSLPHHMDSYKPPIEEFSVYGGWVLLCKVLACHG